MDKCVRRQRRSRPTNEDFVQGNCQICRQTNVRVKQLDCGVHMYCRMCAEFIPRLAKGDLQCKICCDDRKKQEAVDELFYSNTGNRCTTFNVAVHIGDTNVVGNLEGIGTKYASDDENDHDGNNDGWDHLLQSIVSPLPNPDVQSVLVEKSSFVRLSCPSASTYGDDSDRISPRQIKPQTENQRHQSDGTFTSKAEENLPLGNVMFEEKVERQKNSSTNWRQKQAKHASDDSENSEIERGTSPSKEYRLQKQKTKWTLCVSESAEDLDSLRDEIGSIEGPGFDSGSSSRSASLESFSSTEHEDRLSGNRKLKFDEFWDS